MNQQQLHEFINKTSQSGSILGMESIVHLCQELDNPQEKIRVIHIAGTNGKGSTGMLLQSTLMKLGKKVGRFSSPAVFDYEEMFQIQGENISKKRLQKLYATVKSACDTMVLKGYPHPTIFEVETAAAYTYFEEEACDFAIIEVGMGGKSDATNVVKQPVVSVITSISMDHTAFLGNTLTEIAEMKAGIIKEGCPVVALKQKEEVETILINKAKTMNSPLRFADPSEVTVHDFSPDGMKLSVFSEEILETKLTGYTQIENVCLARTVLEVMTQKGLISLSKLPVSGGDSACQDSDWEKMKQGFQMAVWPGRFETILEQPRFIIDGAHNEDAAEKLAKNIGTFFAGKNIRFIVGVLRDKDYPTMLKKVLPYGTAVYCITPKNARGL